MLNYIDDLLNQITMYRLLLYTLAAYLIWAEILAAIGKLAFKPLDLFFSIAVLTIVALLANKIFAWAFEVPANVESDYITAWILALIVTPAAIASPAYFTKLGFLVFVAVLSQAVKYILAWRGKHFFNPAAFAVVVSALAIGQSATWWVGTLWMLPVVIIGGALIVRKIRRFDLMVSFLIAALAMIALTSPGIANPLNLFKRILVDTPIIFLATIMLTEPLTTPPTRGWQIAYGAVTGLLFAPQVHIGSLYTTPEIALLVGNVFSYIVSPKSKHMLTLESKEEAGTNTYEFIFKSKQRVKFTAGQYMEWTLGHKNPDARGNRRYFTIASSPTESKIRLGVKFYPNSSSFKRNMLNLQPGQQILAGSLAGDFILPKDKNKKLVFLAGGIGITPFRSMLQYLLDKNEQRDIVLFYSNTSANEVVYEDVLVDAHEKLNIRTVLTITDKAGVPANWRGHTGYIDSHLLSTELSDYRDRVFYVSGSHSFVTAMEQVLSSLGVPNSQIKTDFFPGFV